MNQAAILAVASLVGGVSNFVESIHGFAPYSFMTVISKILTSSGVRYDELFEDLSHATLVELSALYLLGFQTVLKKTKKSEFKVQPSRPTNFFRGIMEFIKPGSVMCDP